MQVIECWEVLYWDGADRHNHGFYLASEEDANKFKETNKYDMVKKKTIIIFDTLEEQKTHNVEALKKSALAKLTALERQALGFK